MNLGLHAPDNSRNGPALWPAGFGRSELVAQYYGVIVFHTGPLTRSGER
jgi:hypothetical protein